MDDKTYKEVTKVIEIIFIAIVIEILFLHFLLKVMIGV